MPMWAHKPKSTFLVWPHSLAQNPHSCVIYTATPQLPHGHILRIVMPSSNTRLCLAYGQLHGQAHVRVTSTEWFFSFRRSSIFFVFWEHTCYDFDAKTLSSQPTLKIVTPKLLKSI
ncbi:hypothetical protein V6Z11_A06G023900 [Gossypium hirsutum]